MSAAALEDIVVVEDWESPRWRIDSGLYQIVDAEGALVPFHMNESQQSFFDAMWYWNLILKGRQQGFSTFAGIIALDQIMWNESFRCGIIAQTEPDCVKLFRNKIERPYLALPEDLRRRKGKIRSNATELVIGKNGGKESSVQVSMSMRGDTLNYLHVSEFGKICKMAPQRAREIVTGAFKTLAVGQILIVESTAEGEGQYKEFCDEAQANEAAGRKLTEMDFKLHFFPWWKKAGNWIDPDGVEIDANFTLYFAELETKHGVPPLSDGQKAWYVKTAKILKGDMHREEPSYPEEAFKSHIKGAIYAAEMVWLRQHKRITQVPWQADLVVNTFWDFGVSTNNETTVWFHQKNGAADCFIKYYEAEGKGLKHFVDHIKEQGYTLGTHFLPHDGDARVQGDEEEAYTRKEMLERLGLENCVIVPRTKDIDNGIELTSQRMPSCYIDAEACADGIKALDNYVRKYDKARDCFTKPLHNWASNGADSFRQWGQSKSIASPKTNDKPKKKAQRGWKVS